MGWHRKDAVPAVEPGGDGYSAAALAAQSRAPATKRAYGSDWRCFAAWAASQGRSSLPASPETVGDYLAAQSRRLTPGTLERRVSAITVRHRLAGFAFDRHHPAIAEVLAGLKRLVGIAPCRQKDALAGDEIAAIVGCLPRSMAGLRDRAIILLGFASACRRSEPAALCLEDLTFTSEGVALRLRWRKEDPEGRGGLKGIPFGRQEATCPVRALRDWMMAARLGDGPLFRGIDRHGNIGRAALSGEAIAAVVKRAVGRWAAAQGASRDAAAAWVARVAGHSLRAGMITSAASAGASDWQILDVTLHKSRASLRPYVRRGRLFAGTAAGSGL